MQSQVYLVMQHMLQPSLCFVLCHTVRRCFFLPHWLINIATPRAS